MPKPKISRSKQVYFETDDYLEASEMIRTGNWDLYRFSQESLNHRSSKTVTLVSRQAA